MGNPETERQIIQNELEIDFHFYLLNTGRTFAANTHKAGEIVTYHNLYIGASVFDTDFRCRVTWQQFRTFTNRNTAYGSAQ